MEVTPSPRYVSRFSTLRSGARLRDFVVLGYKPPQIPYPETILDLVKTYGVDFRRLYIETPRVRLDGVYIAVCRYLRSGRSDNAWVNVIHEIIYHRYLRFFPDGTVVSLLTSDQIPPREIIPILSPSLRMKGLSTGFWELHDTAVYLTSLADPTGSTNFPYVFQMTLQLTSRPLGRWNKLAILAYDSVHVESGEMVSVSIDQEKTQFAFSKVRSYGY
jgi:F-box protein 9